MRVFTPDVSRGAFQFPRLEDRAPDGAYRWQPPEALLRYKALRLPAVISGNELSLRANFESFKLWRWALLALLRLSWPYARPAVRTLCRRRATIGGGVL
ncbi:hypothetical protein KCP78_03720 [Salmonella enterica subsp. enterica]|nr:hypothetical protein KCP78_03720 [Salmonella enterica subsp. enterica]